MLESSPGTLLLQIALTEGSLRLYSNDDERKNCEAFYTCAAGRSTLGSGTERESCKEKREMGRERRPNDGRVAAEIRLKSGDVLSRGIARARSPGASLSARSAAAPDERTCRLEPRLARRDTRRGAVRGAIGWVGELRPLLNAELGKWKAAVDSVTRLAHKAASEPRANAMTVPMQEDSARLVAAVENINQRFADLSINVQSRGQALQSALSSLQQMEKALDRFLVWLADSEATLDVLETEADRYGPRDD
ncbi:unnamed protein product, partial [Ixodes persulcatus]